MYQIGTGEPLIKLFDCEYIRNETVFFVPSNSSTSEIWDGLYMDANPSLSLYGVATTDSGGFVKVIFVDSMLELTKVNKAFPQTILPNLRFNSGKIFYLEYSDWNN